MLYVYIHVLITITLYSHICIYIIKSHLTRPINIYFNVMNNIYLYVSYHMINIILTHFHIYTYIYIYHYGY